MPHNQEIPFTLLKNVFVCCNIKRGETFACRHRLSPVHKPAFGRCCRLNIPRPRPLKMSHPDSSIVMKNKSFCKPQSEDSLRSEVQSRYDRAAKDFQYRHNQTPGARRIWRHMICRRTFLFLLSGRLVSVTIEIVRFVYAGTHQTFTFYGDLFVPRSHYPVEFIRNAIADRRSDYALCVSTATLRRWEKAGFSAPSPKTTLQPYAAGPHPVV